MFKKFTMLNEEESAGATDHTITNGDAYSVSQNGFPVYEGGEYWYFYGDYDYRIRHSLATSGGAYSNEYIQHTFSTEDAAKEYVALMTTEKLSLSDLLSVWGDGYKSDENSKKFYSNAPLFLKFKELVKSKLK